jgi:hypothetical protein
MQYENSRARLRQANESTNDVHAAIISADLAQVNNVQDTTM